jgi:hypothetical protein
MPYAATPPMGKTTPEVKKNFNKRNNTFISTYFKGYMLNILQQSSTHTLW